MKLMTASKKALEIIKNFEGLRLTAYRCPAGIPTIGWGHTHGVKMGMTITKEQAEAFLLGDIKPTERYLNNMNLNFRQGQFDALVSWIFNLGVGNFEKSTLRKKILAGADDDDICDEIMKWNRAGKRVLAGLTRRRECEVELWKE